LIGSQLREIAQVSGVVLGVKVMLLDRDKYSKQQLELKQSEAPVAQAAAIMASLRRIMPKLLSSNEQTKRDMLISPIIRCLLEETPALLREEYPVYVSPQLQGSLDYLLSVDNLQQLVVIEAKNDDFNYGFTQLFAQLIALDQWERAPSLEAQPLLIGAVTIGEFWWFGQLERRARALTQGLNSYRVPEDVEAILGILIQLFPG
jgi:hypothetical protein